MWHTGQYTPSFGTGIDSRNSGRLRHADVQKVDPPAITPIPTTNAISVWSGAETGELILATFTAPDPTATEADFEATVNWGDDNVNSKATIRKTDSIFEIVGHHKYFYDQFVNSSYAEFGNLPISVVFKQGTTDPGTTVERTIDVYTGLTRQSEWNRSWSNFNTPESLQAFFRSSVSRTELWLHLLPN